MKKILALLSIVAVTVLCECTKENLQTQKPVTSFQKNEQVTAGNKYSVAVKFKANLKMSSTVWLYKDHGTFVVTLDGATGGVVSNVKNYNSNVTFVKNTGTCNVQLINANKGNIQIASSSHVVNFGGNVFITFDSTTTKTPKFSVNCNGQINYLGGASGPSAPIYLQFLDNGQKQVISSPPITVTVTPAQ